MSTAPIYSFTDTWNAAGTVFDGIKLVITNTASAAGSDILDLSITSGASIRFDKTGVLRLSDGTNTGTMTPVSTTGISFGGGLEIAGSITATATNPTLSFSDGGASTGNFIYDHDAGGVGVNAFKITGTNTNASLILPSPGSLNFGSASVRFDFDTSALRTVHGGIPKLRFDGNGVKIGHSNVESTPAVFIDTNDDVSIAKTLNLAAVGTQLTIAAGVVTAVKSYHRVAGEGGVADDLTTINGGTEGDVLVIRPHDSAADITVKDGTGNIQCAGSDIVLAHVNDTALFIFDGTNWLEISRSINS